MLSSDVESVVLILTLLCLLLMLDIGVVTCASEITLVSLLAIFKLMSLSLSLSVPEDYDYNPHTGKRGDRSHHAELRHASVEYIAPSEYMVYVVLT